MRRHLVVPVILVLLSSGLSLAGEKVDIGSEQIERAIIEELLSLTDVEKTLARTREQFKEMMETQLDTLDVPEDSRKQVTKMQQKMIDLIFDEMSWDSLKEDYIDLYVSVFTQEELGGMLTFYRSPVGQSLLAKSPELSTGMMKIVQARMADIQPRIRQMVDEIMSDIDAEEASEVDPN